MSDEKNVLRRAACAVPTKCEVQRSNERDLMSSEWEEYVIRFDRDAGRYVTGTACCAGAPACC